MIRFPIGASDSLTEGHWIYPNGSDVPLSIMNWSGNGPDNYGDSEHSAELVNQDNVWKWNDVRNDQVKDTSVRVCQGGNVLTYKKI